MALLLVASLMPAHAHAAFFKSSYLAPSSDGMSFALMFNRNITDKSTEEGKVQYVFGADNVGTEENEAAPGVHHTYYALLFSDNDWYEHISYFLNNHPDWIVYKNDRRTPAYETAEWTPTGGRPPLDMQNPAVLQYLLDTYYIPAYQGGFGGIAFDNAYSANFKGRAGVYRTDGSVAAQASASSTQIYTASAIPAGTSIAVGNASDMEYTTVVASSGSDPAVLTLSAPLAHSHTAGEWIGVWNQQYSGAQYDPSYRNAALSAFHQLVQLIRSSCPGWTISINHSIEAVFDNPTYWYDFTSDADIVVDEWAYTYLGYENGYLTSSPAYGSSNPWLDETQYLQTLTSQGKAVVLCSNAPSSVVSDPSNPPLAYRQWILANYLLVKGAHTYQMPVAQPYGGPLYWLPEYDAPIGSPTGDMYESQGLYMRQYTNGLVVVNPGDSAASPAALPEGQYTDLHGNQVQSLWLGPHAGAILLNSGASSQSPTSTPTALPQPSNTPSPTGTPAVTPSPTLTSSVSPTATLEPTPRPAGTPTVTSTVAPTPTASSVSTPSVLTYTVYGDQLAPGWKIAPYNASVNLAETNPVYSGSRSTSFTLTGAWGEVNYQTLSPVDVSAYHDLHFAARSAQRASNLGVSFYLNGTRLTANLSVGQYGGQPTTSGWTVYNIPLADFGPISTVSNVIIQDETGLSSRQKYYVDEVGFS